MYKLLLALLVIAFTSPAFGVPTEYCLMDSGVCVIMDFKANSRLSQVLMKRSDWDKFGVDAKALIGRLQGAGTYVNTVSDDYYNRKSINLTPTYYEYTRIASGLSDIPNEQWDAWAGTSACIGVAGACAVAGGTTFASLGSMVFWTAIWCGGAAHTCVDALRKWEIWEKVQKKMADEEREAAIKAQQEKAGVDPDRPQPPAPANPIPIPPTPTITINPGRTPAIGGRETPPGGGELKPIWPKEKPKRD